LRCRLPANSDDEARPRTGDDDEPVRNARRLPAARIPQPVRAPQPDRLCGVVELCARHCHECAGIPKFHRSQGTDWVGRVHPDWRSLDRVGSSKAVCRASFYGVGVGLVPFETVT
jgi:hypothetical protein